VRRMLAGCWQEKPATLFSGGRQSAIACRIYSAASTGGGCASWPHHNNITRLSRAFNECISKITYDWETGD